MRPRALTIPAAGVLAILVCPLTLPAASPDPPSVTFFVASDSHFGARGMDEQNRILVAQMNELPGTAYPPEIGGVVEKPRGVLFTGDTTDNALLEEFAEFEKVYGLTGRDGLLAYPVFESIGNHDLGPEAPIKDKARLRHGGIDYSWDWDDLHFVCLDMYPDATTRAWLARDLARISSGTPLVLFFHYSLEGPYSDFWEQADKDAFAADLAGRNVLAIFHGHEHRVGHYMWRGHPVFRPGAPRHSSHAFLAVRVGSLSMDVAAWDFDNRRWLTSWSVPVRRLAAP
jgi:hypothetical protein